MTRIQCLFTAALLALAAVGAHAQSELRTYVNRCQAELQFAAHEVQPMNCNEGVQFATNGGRGPINDFVVHKRVNQNVDMVAACRWGSGTSTLDDNEAFASLELIIHNRVNGGTCFFAARDLGTEIPLRPISPAIVSPTFFSPSAPVDADDFWLTPTEMNAKLLISDASPGNNQFKEQLQCVRCHSQGPYIASANIAPFLADMGLLNDGHHTHSDFSALGHYYVVGSNSHTDPNSGSHPLKNWNHLIATHNRPATLSCSAGCHALAREKETSFTPIGTLRPVDDTSGVLLPSIAFDLDQLRRFGLMEPGNEDSPWRWVNIDQPANDGVEIETFTASKSIPITGYCGVPGWLEAKSLHSDSVFSTEELRLLPNKLRSFNLRDGLVCMNSDQPGGVRCHDHQVSYKCPAGPNTVWTPWYNKDQSTNDDGDHEERWRAIAEATAFCGGKAPISMRAQVLVRGSVIYQATAPADRLAQFSPTGLVCRNSEQGGGQSCNSYTVRYRGCRGGASLSKVKNAWISPPTFGDRYLTTTNNVDGAETRAQANNYQYPSQDWIIEPVPGGNTVRLADVWSGKYLTASSNSDLAAVQVRNSDTSLMRQQWVRESIAGSTEVRFRNVGTGRYLTVGNYSGDPYYAPIVSQTLSNQNWASQRWVIQ